VANSAKNQKLIQEVVGLVVVAVIAGGYFAYTSIHNAKSSVQNTKAATPLDTSFNTKAIEHFNDKSTYPDVTPTSNELGKTDPFVQ
jgi:uncharacterized membrane protein YebE (DUF533 family)